MLIKPAARYCHSHGRFGVPKCKKSWSCLISGQSVWSKIDVYTLKKWRSVMGYAFRSSKVRLKGLRPTVICRETDREVLSLLRLKHLSEQILKDCKDIGQKYKEQLIPDYIVRWYTSRRHCERLWPSELQRYIKVPTYRKDTSAE